MSLVKRLLPLTLKRKIKNLQEDRQRKRLFGALAPLVPPVALMYDGPPGLAEFKANGEEFFKIYRERCGLRPDEAMLDIGCGTGRKTLPLTRYLDARTAYEGLDITKQGIDWCREHITPRFPNFNFQQIDVYNKLYNPGGTYRAVEYKFPFPDASFRFITLGSVFTHMLPDDLENYLSEVARMLAPGGRCLISYFLLNEESLRHVEAGEGTLDLRYVFDNYRVISTEVPEEAIAFDEDWVKNLYDKLGLKIMGLDYGSWCGRAAYLSYQDLVLAVKT
ncbi:MAG TPA: class I SAM-dependent methyltransferase [Pyrinomonadaceae bacterium]|nr:class I SAM-dependent methyltransferase [Pyrinomonadaceae bacterium]